jgi:hypothetical protein
MSPAYRSRVAAPTLSVTAPVDIWGKRYLPPLMLHCGIGITCNTFHCYNYLSVNQIVLCQHQTTTTKQKQHLPKVTHQQQTTMTLVSINGHKQPTSFRGRQHPNPNPNPNRPLHPWGISMSLFSHIPIKRTQQVQRNKHSTALLHANATA